MSWMSTEFTPTEVNTGAYHRVLRQFQRAFIAAGAPADMALFAAASGPENGRRIYLSPGSAEKFSVSVDGIEWKPCNLPEAVGLTLVFGLPDAKLRLIGLPEPEAETRAVEPTVAQTPPRANGRQGYRNRQLVRATL